MRGIAIVLTCIAATRVTAWFVNAQSLPADAQATCTVTTGGAPAFPTWFESLTVTANGVVKPANSLNFPDNPNCSFYQWSYQMFLWATSPAPLSYGGGGGRIFESPAFFDVSPLDASLNRTLIPHTNRLTKVLTLRADAEHRTDDSPEVFIKRLGDYNRDIGVLREHYGPLLVAVRGEGDEVELLDRILAGLRARG